MKRIFSYLTFQVIVAILMGILVGTLSPSFAPVGKLISQTFINLITMLISPIIFLTIVLGIAHIGDMKQVGKIGGKALLYFEVVSTIALVIGMVVANIIRAGDGVDATPAIKGSTQKIEQFKSTASGFQWSDFLSHLVPHNIFESFAKGDILQILFFAILFGFGLAAMKDAGKPLLGTFDRLLAVFFQIMKFIMKLAPFAAFGGMAYTIGTYGFDTLVPMAKLMMSVYLTMAIFIFGVLNFICYLYKFSLWGFLKYIKQELLIVLGTSSSESVLPSMMRKMEKFGCNKSVVGLVIPTGYSFNLDGTSIYLSMALLFLAQANDVSLSLAQQLSILGVLMITSKGAAAVTGGGFIVLASTLAALKVVPVESMAILLGVDRFMSEGRAITNLIGNGVATVVIAKSEKLFDDSPQPEES